MCLTLSNGQCNGIIRTSKLSLIPLDSTDEQALYTSWIMLAIMLLNHLFPKTDSWVFTTQVSLGPVSGSITQWPWDLLYHRKEQYPSTLCWGADLRSMISQHELTRLKCVADPSSYMKGFQKPFAELVLSALSSAYTPCEPNFIPKIPNTLSLSTKLHKIGGTSISRVTQLLNWPCLQSRSRGGSDSDCPTLPTYVILSCFSCSH